MSCYVLKKKFKNTDLSSSIYKQAGVAVDAFAPTQVMIVTTVHSSNPDHAIHLLCKVPPLKQETYIETNTVGSQCQITTIYIGSHIFSVTMGLFTK